VSDHYILDENRNPVKVELLTWARQFEKAEDRRVDLTETWNGRVSTVFLGLDHQWGDGPPLIFETMVFGGTLDQEMERYSTWDEAVRGHAAMVSRVNDG
jgi:hypothetical protein